MQVGNTYTRTITTFWHRRIAEVATFSSVIVIVGYFLPFFISFNTKTLQALISDWSVIVAAVVAIYSIILYLWVPTRRLFLAASSIYLGLLILAGSLVVSTGGAASPLIAVWLAVVAFAYAFSWSGIILVSFLLTSYITYTTLLTPSQGKGSLAVLIVLTTIASIASFIIFHAKTRNETIDETYDSTNTTAGTPRHDNKADVVIHAIDDGVLSLDGKGVIQLVNPAAQRILGWGSKDAEKLSYASVLKLTDDKNQAITDDIDPVMTAIHTNKSTETDKLFATTGGGKRILLSITVSPVGQMGSGVIVVFRDITRKSAEEREQAEFISTASHEMRTPVASIEGYLGLALNPQTATIDDKARDYIEKAHASAKHLGRLFQDLLDVSKADDGRLSNHPKVVDVAAYLADIVEGLRPKAEEKGLRLYYKPSIDTNTATSRSLSPVYFSNVDNDHLREAVANLTENAIKYTLQGDVIVDVGGTADTVTISIKDSGIGIAKEDLGHLFQKFYRIDNSATREIGGTGLGLYLCRRLAETMGGRIWAESELNQGSTFHLELPRLDHTDAMRMMEAESVEISAVAETGQSPFIPDNTVSANPLIEPQPPVQPATIAVESPQPAMAPVAQQPVQQATTPAQPQPVTESAPVTTPPAAQTVESSQAQQMNLGLQQYPAFQQQSHLTLSAIEQNPSDFLGARQTTAMQVPTRDNTPPPPPRA